MIKLIALSILIPSIFIYKTKTSTSYITQQTPLEESIARGEILYLDFCMSCHLDNGKGEKGTYPPLAKSDFLMKNRKESIRIIKYGNKGELIVNGETYNGFMAAPGLSDDEVADVMNYISNSWGNENKKMITEAEVSEIKK